MTFLLVRFLPPDGVLIALLVVQVIAMCGVTLLALMYEEDWWNDFQDQNRSILLGLAGNVASVALGVWLAHSI